jgi:hypothetical protein
MTETAEKTPEEPPQPTSEPDDVPDAQLADDEDAAAWEQFRRIYYNKVDIHFHDEVDASEAVFGVGSGGSHGRNSVRRATGILDRHEIDRALRWFVRPSPFDAAYRKLIDGHLLVLVGDDGCGRRAGALALLRHVVGIDATLTSMSPALSFADLASGRMFQEGRGYLVQDHIGDREAAAVREFEASRLADKLTRVKAFLIVTATATAVSHRCLREFVVPWQHPDPVMLFDKCFGDTHLEPAILETARTRAGQLCTPHAVISFAQRVIADPHSAMHGLDDSSHDEVANWLDGKPGKRDVLAIAALAFLHGLPERTFECHLARLLELSYGEARPETQGSSAMDDRLQQHRIGFAKEHALVTAERRDVLSPIGQINERVTIFRSPQYRGHVISQLSERYDYELWEPLRQWLDELAASALPETRVELGLGLALLARIALGEVLDIIDRWADQETAAERLTAAITLWWMCAEDSLAPMALQTALRWIHNRGPRRAITAAIALGGDLGLRYQSDALRWLWFLARRAERIGAVARKSIAFLFAVSVKDSATSTGVLNLAKRELCSTAQADGRTVRAVRQAVVAMLCAVDIDTEQPVVVSVLRGQPENIPTLGAMWAEVLCSTPHRYEAYDALVRTLSAMTVDQLELVRQLGAAVLSGMPHAHRQVLRRDLLHTSQNANSLNRPPRELVAALLTTLDRPNQPAAFRATEELSR